jgi:hypothetical protein
LQLAPRAFAIGRGADDIEVRLEVEQGRQRATDHRLVLGDQDAESRA